MYWTHKALDWGNKSLSGLLYAPWLHEDIIDCTEEALEVVFFLLILNSAVEYNLYAYYLVYSDRAASAVIRSRINKDGIYYSFSIHNAADIWDEKQWGKEYRSEMLPKVYHTNRLQKMNERINSIVQRFEKIIVSEA